MSYQVYKFSSGQCTCILGDFFAGSQRVSVRKMSATGILIESVGSLRNNQFVYTSVVLEDGPSLALSGVVINSTEGGTFIQWVHDRPEDAAKLDETIRSYLKLPPAPVEEPAPEPVEKHDEKAGARKEESTLQKSPSKTAVKVQTGPPQQEKDPVKPPAKPQKKIVLRGPSLVREKSKGKKPPAAKPDSAPAPGLPKKSFDQVTLGTSKTEAPEIVRAGGKVDVTASIRKSAKTVRSADLASVMETVQVLNVETIKNLIKEAVDESVSLLGQRLSEAEHKRFLEEAEDNFKERLEAFKSEKAGLEEKTKYLQGQLEKAQAFLEKERKTVLHAHQFTVSDSGMVELEQRLGRMIDWAIKKGNISKDLEAEMRIVVARLLDDERQKIRDQVQMTQNDKIALLEKKVSRLANSLESTEKERDCAQRRAKALEAAGGVFTQNLATAGLSDEDPNKERKLGLLKEIVKFNKEMRERLATEGRLPKGRMRPEMQGKGEEKSPALLKEKTEKLVPVDQGALPSDASPSDDQEDSEDTDRIPVFSTGGEADPDDQLWESQESYPGKESKAVDFKRLGG